jgi:hypothetical protein
MNLLDASTRAVLESLSPAQCAAVRVVLDDGRNNILEALFAAAAQDTASREAEEKCKFNSVIMEKV